MREDPWYMNSDPWSLVQTSPDPDRNIYFETVLSQANGYMGVRGYQEEPHTVGKTCRESYLAGVFSEVNEEGTEIIGDFPWPVLQMVSLPDLFQTRIVLDETEFDPTCGTIEDYERRLDLRNALLSRRVIWEDPRGRRTKLVFNRFLSADVPHLACQKVVVTPLDWQGSVRIQHRLGADPTTYFRCGDTTQPNIPHNHFVEQEIHARGEQGGFQAVTDTTGHEVAIIARMTGQDVTSTETETVIRQQRSAHATPDQPIVSERFMAVVNSRDDLGRASPEEKAEDVINEAATAGFNSLLADHSDVWDQRWQRADVEITGNKLDQKVLRFNIFQLLQMAPFHSDGVSLPARGLSFNRYRGLYFWDTEIFLVPFYQWAFPEVARNLLTFRHRTLPGARENAEHWGGEGAMYPWMTDSETGRDNSIDARVWKIFHQIADIAYAVDDYAAVSGNTEFMAQKGTEILVETARFFVSRFTQDSDGAYHLEETIGPDEDHAPGRDNGFTCLMARRNLRLAAHWMDELEENQPGEAGRLREELSITDGEIKEWRSTAENLTVPQVPGTDIPLQDEHFLGKKEAQVENWRWREEQEKWTFIPENRGDYQVIKQADIVLATYLLRDQFSAEQIAEAYDFYEPKTLHLSSLSWNTHAMVAARLGRKEEAYEYYLNSAGLDLDDLKHVTADGLHAAALGGCWQAVVLGMVGLENEGEEPTCAPNLPPSWEKVRFRISHHGTQYEMTAHQDGSWEADPLD